MVHSGQTEEGWDRAVECHCFVQNVYDEVAVGKTAYQRRYCVKTDQQSRSETELSYTPSSSKDGSRLHELVEKI